METICARELTPDLTCEVAEMWHIERFGSVLQGRLGTIPSDQGRLQPQQPPSRICDTAMLASCQEPANRIGVVKDSRAGIDWGSDHGRAHHD